MGPGLHPELVNCRRVRFDIRAHNGKPRFRLIYRNEPSDGAPAGCHWLTSHLVPACKPTAEPNSAPATKPKADGESCPTRTLPAPETLRGVR